LHQRILELEAVAPEVAAEDAGPIAQVFALDRYRAQTERLKALADFLHRPICAHGASDADPDIVTAYNLGVEAALKAIRKAAIEV